MIAIIVIAAYIAVVWLLTRFCAVNGIKEDKDE